MPEQSEQGQPQRATIAEQGLTPEIHLKERITDPKRLAEIVLNTLDTTLNDTLPRIDEGVIDKLMKNPSQNWNNIVNMVTGPAKKAVLLVSQMATINQALYIIEEYNESLPISVSGNPPKTTVDRPGVEQLIEQKGAENATRKAEEAEEQKDWPFEETEEYRKAERAKFEKKVYADPVRRLARFISYLQGDAVMHSLTLVKGYEELLSLRGKAGYNPTLEPIIRGIIQGMTEAEEYALYERRVLKLYTQGKLPNEDIIRATITGGTQTLRAYLETFGGFGQPTNLLKKIGRFILKRK